MRFVLFDRVTAFEAGKRIEGVKLLSASDDAFGAPTGAHGYPPALVLEAMVQLLAWTAIAKHGFIVSVVMAGVDDVEIPPDLKPGTVLAITGHLLGTNPKGSLGRVEARVDGEVVARAGRVLYAHVEGMDPAVMQARFAALGGPA
ncbi:MAG: hypothetical protein AB7T63_16850 [Planctomycetota bacterium]